MNAIEQRAAVEAHPPVVVTRSIDRSKEYDLRAIALWILDHPEESRYRLNDWWHAPIRTRESHPRWPASSHGRPVYFLGFEIELAAYRLLAAASRGESYGVDDEDLKMDLVLSGGCPG